MISTNSLQRSKSLSSADTLARGIAGLGLGLGTETTDIGTFNPEIQVIVDQALKDPNQLNARALMELANQIMQRAVEGRRFNNFLLISKIVFDVLHQNVIINFFFFISDMLCQHHVFVFQLLLKSKKKHF